MTIIFLCNRFFFALDKVFNVTISSINSEKPICFILDFVSVAILKFEKN